MTVSSRTPEGAPHRCPVCGNIVYMEPSVLAGDMPCPSCGSLLWFVHSMLGSEIGGPFPDAIITDLVATSKRDVIREIVTRLSTLGAIGGQQVEDIVQALLDREALGSTAIGNGFAVPHARHASVDRFVGATVLSRDGIEFDSIDGRPVHTIILLVSPADRPGDQLRALERISRHLRRL